MSSGRAFKVYLAGAIAGLAFDGAQEWRTQVTEALAPEVECYSPLRNKGFLRAHGIITTDAYQSPMATDRGIMTRDHWDCMTSDLIFFNLLDAKDKSLGTVMELAWAFAYRKPTVCAIEPNGNLHDHPMVREAINYRVATLAEAVTITRSILLHEATR